MVRRILGALSAAAAALSIAFVTVQIPAASATTALQPGYVLFARDGGVFTFGSSPFIGALPPRSPAAPIVSGVPEAGGDLLVDAAGHTYPLGTAPGPDLGTLHLAAPIVGAIPAPAGGLWMVGADGGVFALAGAPFYGSLGGSAGADPIVGMAPTPDGRGYWLVSRTGQVFAFGDAAALGGLGALRLQAPIVGITSWPGLAPGYELVGADGGVFAFGSAPYLGSLAGRRLNAPIVALEPLGTGYLLIGADGGVFSFGGAPFLGSLGGLLLRGPVVSAVAGFFAGPCRLPPGFC
jgi:hypothetical protein